jgi:hypothetical protein
VNVNGVPRDREHFGAARGAVFTIVAEGAGGWRLIGGSTA